MTANMAYTWIKQRGRWMQALREMADKVAREPQVTPAQQAERNEAWSELREALQGISAEKRVVVVLYYLNDLSITEIAEILELPTGTVKSRLHYGRQALRQYLGLEGNLVPKIRYEAT
jgi:RNA polymerase sigma factor (sigma-70 family)